jgi:hypothetical protein
VAIVEIQDVNGKKDKGRNKKSARAGFLSHLRMLAEWEVVSRQGKIKGKRAPDVDRRSSRCCCNQRQHCPPLNSGGQRL